MTPRKATTKKEKSWQRKKEKRIFHVRAFLHNRAAQVGGDVRSCWEGWKVRCRCRPLENHRGLGFLHAPSSGHGLAGAACGGEIS